MYFGRNALLLGLRILLPLIQTDNHVRNIRNAVVYVRQVGLLGWTIAGFRSGRYRFGRPLVVLEYQDAEIPVP